MHTISGGVRQSRTVDTVGTIVDDAPVIDATRPIQAGTPAARTATVGFLWLQAALIGGWWVWLWLSPGARPWFAFSNWPEDVALAFFVPDLAVLVLGAAVAAVAVQREAHWAMCAFSAVLGSAIYATLFCVGASVLGHGNTLCLALMVLLSVGNAAAFALAYRHRTVRTRTPGAT